MVLVDWKSIKRGVFLTLSSQSSFTATLLGFKSCKHACKSQLWHCILLKYELCHCMLLKLLNQNIFYYTITMAYFFVKTPAACKVDAKQKLWRSEGKVLTLWIRPAEWMYCLWGGKKVKPEIKREFTLQFITDHNICLLQFVKKKRTQNVLALRPLRSW